MDLCDQERILEGVNGGISPFYISLLHLIFSLLTFLFAELELMVFHSHFTFFFFFTLRSYLFENRENLENRYFLLLQEADSCLSYSAYDSFGLGNPELGLKSFCHLDHIIAGLDASITPVSPLEVFQKPL